MDKKKTPAPAQPPKKVRQKTSVPSSVPVDHSHSRRTASSTHRHHSHIGQVRSRTRILRFVVSPILLAAALVCAVFAVLEMTVWRPSPLVTASANISSRYIVTDPGVLGLVDHTAGVRLNAQEPACMALATSQDAAGWVSGLHYTRVTGLSSWSRLSTKPQTATSVADTGGDSTFQDSDLWRRVQCGNVVEMQTKAAASSPLVLIIDTNPQAGSASSGLPVRLSLTWERTHITDAALPLWLSAGLLLLASLLCFFIFSLSARRRRKARERVESEVREDPSLAHEREQRNIAGSDAPRWADDNLRSRRRRESRHRHATHRSLFAALRDNVRTSHAQAKKKSAQKKDASASPVITEVRRANMVARLQETQTIAPISAPIRREGVGEKIDNGEGRPPSYTPPSSEEIKDYLRRLAAERLGTSPSPQEEKGSSQRPDASQNADQAKQDTRQKKEDK